MNKCYKNKKLIKLGFIKKTIKFRKAFLKGKREKDSLFKKELIEEHKLRFVYGCRKSFIRRLIRDIGNKYTINKLIKNIRRRLDYYLVKLGVVKSIFEAKQKIVHGFIKINNLLCKVPSLIIKNGDKISFKADLMKDKEINKNDYYGKIYRKSNSIVIIEGKYYDDKYEKDIDMEIIKHKYMR